MTCLCENCIKKYKAEDLRNFEIEIERENEADLISDWIDDE
jgi:hypothetical protein